MVSKESFSIVVVSKESFSIVVISKESTIGKY